MENRIADAGISVGFVVMDRDGKLVRAGYGRNKKRATLYQHSGHARRIARSRRLRGAVLPAFTKNAATDGDMLVGFCLVDADEKPIRTNRNGDKVVSLYNHAGFAAVAARYHGGDVRRVFI